MARTVGLVFDTKIDESANFIPEEDISDINDITDGNGDICIDKMTVAQLKRFAKDNGIDIGSASRKDEIIQAITAAGDTNTEV